MCKSSSKVSVFVVGYIAGDAPNLKSEKAIGHNGHANKEITKVEALNFQLCKNVTHCDFFIKGAL